MNEFKNTVILLQGTFTPLVNARDGRTPTVPADGIPALLCCPILPQLDLNVLFSKYTRVKNMIKRLLAITTLIIMTSCQISQPEKIEKITDVKASEITSNQNSNIFKVSDPRKNDTHRNNYLVIAWSHPESGGSISNPKYQISGSDVILTKKQVVRTLQILSSKNPKSIYVMGNNWGIGRELEKEINLLSDKYSIKSTYSSPSLFYKVDFLQETKQDQKLILESVNKAIKNTGPKNSADTARWRSRTAN